LRGSCNKPAEFCFSAIIFQPREYLLRGGYAVRCAAMALPRRVKLFPLGFAPGPGLALISYALRLLKIVI
jgi:hypothetical protein